MPVAAPGEPMRTLQINEAGSNRRGEVERWMSVVQDTISRCMWANKHSEERHSPCPQRVTQSGGEEECVCKRCFRRTDLQELWPHRGTVLCLFLRFSLESLKVTCTSPFLQSTQKDLLKNKQTNKKWTTGFSLGSHSCK